MTLLTNYQYRILKSLKKHDFAGRISKMKGKCHDALIGEWVNWWLSQNIDGMIFNPARGSRKGAERYVADLLFLERFRGYEYFDVKGVEEVENNEHEIMHKIESLASYEDYFRDGQKVYPEIEFAVLSYKMDIPNDKLANDIYNKILRISDRSNLLWIVCELGRSLGGGEEPDYSIHMPNPRKGVELFYYYRNFSSLIFYFVKNGKQIEDVFVPGFDAKLQ